MPYKLSNDKRNNVISLIKAGKGTTDIAQATGVSKAQVVRMKKEHDPDRIKSRGGRVSTVLRPPIYRFFENSAQFCEQFWSLVRGEVDQKKEIFWPTF